jgi:uncharacterized protein
MEIITHHIWIGFAGGLLGFAHCLGMCGGFVVHLTQGQSTRRFPTAPLFWLTGKLFSYLFLGALAGFAGGFLAASLQKIVALQNLLSYLAGGAILWAGLSLLGLFPARQGSNPGLASGLTATLARQFFSAPSPGSALILGLATGLLPCPIVLAFLAYALQSGSVVTGMLTMGALGLGTSVPLLLLGCVSRISRLPLRRWAPRAGGIILVVLGLTTALRGTTMFHHLLGCPQVPGLHQVATDTTKPCCTGEAHGHGSGN